MTGDQRTPYHNHMTRDIKPPGECPGCDNGRLPILSVPEQEAATAANPAYGITVGGQQGGKTTRMTAEFNAHLKAVLEQSGQLEWAVFRRADPADAPAFDEARYSTRQSAAAYIKLGFLEAVGKTLEPRCRLVSEWMKA